MAVLRRGGIDSDGDPDGESMREAIRAARATDAPAGLVIDLRRKCTEVADTIAFSVLGQEGE
jgi:hypothetical protein